MHASKPRGVAAVVRGFTLIELLITLAVMAVVLSWALPSLQTTLARNQLLGQAHEVAGALSLARNEAVIRGSQTGICASKNGTSCSGSNGDWDQWILVFVDLDGGSDFDGGEPVLKALSAHDDVSQTAGASAYYFNAAGFSRLNSNSDIEVCHNDIEQYNGCRVVSIRPSGAVMVRSKDKTTGDAS